MSVVNFKPTEDEIKEVMRLTGMDYLQARRNVQQRMYLQSMLNGNRR
jgi:hypothetical protein